MILKRAGEGRKGMRLDATQTDNLKNTLINDEEEEKEEEEEREINVSCRLL